MALITVLPGTTSTIATSETDVVTLGALSTLDIFGTPSNVINVTLSQVTGVGAASTIAINYATVMLGGVASATALVNYTVGPSGRLEIGSTANLSLGSTVTFTGNNGRLDLANGLNLSPLDTISGFGSGNLIDVGSGVATHTSYAAHAGTNTGGDLSLLDANNNVVSTLDLANGTYTNANFKLAADGAGGTLVSYATAVTGVVDNPVTALLGLGGAVTLTVSLQNPVAVTGTPRLLLNDGGVATYDAARSTATALAFDYTVGAGQNTADLAITGVDLNGATLATVGGGGVDLSGAVTNPAGTLSVDTIAPTVTTVSLTPGSGTVTTGQTVMVALGMSENVTYAGAAPILQLSDGGVATFNAAASTASRLVFTHVVQAGQTAADLAITGTIAGARPVADAAGNALDLSGAVGNPAGTLVVTSTGSGGTGGGGTGGGGTGGGGTGGISATIPVYRFFDTKAGTHFYTTSGDERNQILATRPDLVSEGPGGVGLRAVNPASNDPNASEVFRFFDTVHGTQFLTANANERDNLIATRTDLVYEPAGNFYEHATPGGTDTAVYRFFSSTDGTHFYTDSAAERATVIQTRPDLIAEGVGFYEPA